MTGRGNDLAVQGPAPHRPPHTCTAWLLTLCLLGCSDAGADGAGPGTLGAVSVPADPGPVEPTPAQPTPSVRAQDGGMPPAPASPAQPSPASPDVGAMTEQSDDPCADLPEGAFCDGFDGPALDLEKWWYGRKVWGLENHGVIPENVRVQEGQVWFASNGDSYSGDLQGVRKTGGSYVQDQPGQRVGGVIVSDRYFGPGRYEFRMALPDETGVCSALWTYHYQELYSDHPAYDDANHASLPAHGSADDGWYKTPNHEIDIEIPTALAGEPDDQASYRNARYNTWVGETVYTDEFHDNGYAYNDGAFHTWRFDWHTGDDPRVDFYVDGQQMHRSTTDIPRVHGRLWLGTWFPLWAGSQANFDVTHLKLDWVRFTPFDEPVLTPPETYAGDGLTRCHTQAENDMGASHCALTEF